VNWSTWQEHGTKKKHLYLLIMSSSPKDMISFLKMITWKSYLLYFLVYKSNPCISQLHFFKHKIEILIIQSMFTELKSCSILKINKSCFYIYNIVDCLKDHKSNWTKKIFNIIMYHQESSDTSINWKMYPHFNKVPL